MPNEIFEYYFDKILPSYNCDCILQFVFTYRKKSDLFMLKVYFSNKYIF